MNKAMLMKLGWEIVTRRDKLWVQVLRSRYSCGDNIVPVVVKKQIESNTWRGIRSCWHLVVNNLRWRIHDGYATRFWCDTWLGENPLVMNARSDVPMADLDRSVRSYVTNEGDWDWNSIRSILPTGDCMNLASILPPFGTNRPDEVFGEMAKTISFLLRQPITLLKAITLILLIRFGAASGSGMGQIVSKLACGLLPVINC